MGLPACGNKDCSASTGICEEPTFGRGKLDQNGYWEIPCGLCARAFEKAAPEYGHCWPRPAPVAEDWRCQFCGKDSCTSAWKKAGSVCPHCKRPYDAQLAQDSEE